MPLPVVEVAPLTLLVVPLPLPEETARFVLPPTPAVLETPVELAPAPAPVTEPLVVFAPWAPVFEALELVTMLGLVVPLEVGVDVLVASTPTGSAAGSAVVLEHALSANKHKPVGNERIEIGILVDDSCKLLGKASAPIAARIPSYRSWRVPVVIDESAVKYSSDAGRV